MARCLRGPCLGRYPGGTRRRGGVPWLFVHHAIPLFRTRDARAAVRQPPPAPGINTARAATRSVDRQRLHEQRDRESLLLVGTNGEESLVPHETQDRRRRSLEHRATVPNAR